MHCKKYITLIVTCVTNALLLETLNCLNFIFKYIYISSLTCICLMIFCACDLVFYTKCTIVVLRTKSFGLVSLLCIYINFVCPGDAAPCGVRVSGTKGSQQSASTSSSTPREKTTLGVRPNNRQLAPGVKIKVLHARALVNFVNPMQWCCCCGREREYKLKIFILLLRDARAV